MFLLDGKPLALDTPFTDPATGVQYPANWLRLATPEERANYDDNYPCPQSSAGIGNRKMMMLGIAM